VGDFGFDYRPLAKVDPDRHKILPGNHDNYDIIPQYPNFLGDFGTFGFPGFEFFYIRGGLSIDKGMRVMGRSWWAQEELNYQQAEECIKAYEQAKPKYVVSHECPVDVASQISDSDPDECGSYWGVILPSFTSKLLQRLLEIHQPDFWFFGHWHRNLALYYDGNAVTRRGKELRRNFARGTMFICLGELGHFDIDKDGVPMMPAPK
jgi:hypothetical protein